MVLIGEHAATHSPRACGHEGTKTRRRTKRNKPQSHRDTEVFDAAPRSGNGRLETGVANDD
jgi:hypothetical protein